MAKNLLNGPSMIGRWIARLDQYHFKTIQWPRTQHRNVDGLSKRTNDYIHREQVLEKLPEVSEGINFMSQKDYDDLPTKPFQTIQLFLRKLELDYPYYISYERNKKAIFRGTIRRHSLVPSNPMGNYTNSRRR